MHSCCLFWLSKTNKKKNYSHLPLHVVCCEWYTSYRPRLRATDFKFNAFWKIPSKTSYSSPQTSAFPQEEKQANRQLPGCLLIHQTPGIWLSQVIMRENLLMSVLVFNCRQTTILLERSEVQIASWLHTIFGERMMMIIMLLGVSQ